MELHRLKQLTPIQATKFKSGTKSGGGGGGGGNKFVGVRQRPSGRWVAEIKDTTQKIRMWLGTFETADEAARAYDEAACLLRGANTRTNFTATRRPATGESPLATRIRKLLHHRKLSSDPSLPPPPSCRHQNPAFSPSLCQNPVFFPLSAASDGGGTPSSSPSTTTTADSGSVFVDEFENGPSMAEASWAFDAMFDCFWEMGGGAEAAAEAAEATEFERMKVERQISASLYAMNGVHEYFEAVQDLSSSLPASSLLDPVWDLPPLLHFSGN